ncbi:ABC1 family protein [Smittium mucronatum]|uniref:ABC1 family protein n=1 Tax=Smittium mucronatum TaxID=133383 RepID=A0A1R0H6E6_9FUNG|nr:ABC1 family protein [Smittium mucronatum]
MLPEIIRAKSIAQNPSLAIFTSILHKSHSLIKNKRGIFSPRSRALLYPSTDSSNLLSKFPPRIYQNHQSSESFTFGNPLTSQLFYKKPPTKSSFIVSNQFISSVRTFTTNLNPEQSSKKPNSHQPELQNPKNNKSGNGRTRKFLLYFLATSFGIYYIDQNYYYQSLQRSLRTIFYTGLVIADYTLNFNQGKSKEELEELHERTAKRLLYVCRTNGWVGIIK